MKWRFWAEFLCTRVGVYCSLEKTFHFWIELSKSLSKLLRNKCLKVFYGICQPCVSSPSHMTLSTSVGAAGWSLRQELSCRPSCPHLFVSPAWTWVSKLPSKTEFGWGRRSAPSPPLTSIPLHCPCSHTRAGSSSSFTFPNP